MPAIETRVLTPQYFGLWHNVVYRNPRIQFEYLISQLYDGPIWNCPQMSISRVCYRQDLFLMCGSVATNYMWTVARRFLCLRIAMQSDSGKWYSTDNHRLKQGNNSPNKNYNIICAYIYALNCKETSTFSLAHSIGIKTSNKLVKESFPAPCLAHEGYRFGLDSMGSDTMHGNSFYPTQLDTYFPGAPSFRGLIKVSKCGTMLISASFVNMTQIGLVLNSI